MSEVKPKGRCHEAFSEMLARIESENLGGVSKLLQDQVFRTLVWQFFSYGFSEGGKCGAEMLAGEIKSDFARMMDEAGTGERPDGLD